MNWTGAPERIDAIWFRITTIDVDVSLLGEHQVVINH